MQVWSVCLENGMHHVFFIICQWIPPWVRHFCNINASLLRGNEETICILHIILHKLFQTINLSSSPTKRTFTYKCMLEHILLLTNHAISFILLNCSCSLKYEMKHWITSDETRYLCILCVEQIWEAKNHILIQSISFHTLSIGSPPITYAYSSHNCNVLTSLQHFSVKF